VKIRSLLALPRGRLRTRFLLSLLLISALLTCATLLIVRYRVRLQVREEIRQDLKNSVVTFENFQRLREATLERAASLLASQPLVEALMTSEHEATIQDASVVLWQRIGSGLGLLVFADRRADGPAHRIFRPDARRSPAVRPSSPSQR
jgi:hypothetical protein